MEVTKNEKRLIAEAVLSLYAGRFREADKHSIIEMLMELQRTDGKAVITYEGAEVILKALQKFPQDTSELEARISEDLKNGRKDRQV